MMRKYFAGTGTLVRFILRRDRLRIPAWILGITIFTVALAPVFEGMFGTEAERLVMAETMLNPAMVAMVGPVFGIADYHVAAMFANMMLAFMCLITAVMNIYFVTRHTRADEEQGRFEVIRSLPVGRLSGLGSVLVSALMMNLLVALAAGIGLGAFGYEGFTWNGAFLFGAVIGICGFLFAGITAVFCQMSANNRTATGFSLIFLMLLYLLRAAGDISAEVLAWISPLGLALRTQVFVLDLWWPVLVIAAVTIACIGLAFALAVSRDLGRGLLPEKPGRHHAPGWLNSPLGLALKLTKTTIIIWAAVIFLFAAMYASVFGDLENFIANNNMLSAIFPEDSGFSFAEQFIGLLMIIMSVIATIPMLNLMLRVRGEEKQGFTEHLLSRSVSRTSQFAAYFGIAMIMGMFCQLLTALGFWTVGSMTMDTKPDLGMFLQAALAYLPAMWVMTGLAAALTGLFPEKSSLSYAYLGLGFFLVYIGSIAQLPDWMIGLSPYGHVSRLPVEEFEVVPLVIMAAIALILSIVGFIGYGKRDMKTD